MKLFRPDARQRRMLGATFAIAFVTTVLLTAFFQTQVVRGSQYAVRSEENRLRPVVIPAPRGTILDRNGEVIATSITGYSISILPGDSAVVHRTLNDLAPFLGLAGSRVDALMRRRAGRPHDLLEVTPSATFAQAAAIEERRSAFPNLVVVERPRRYYPAGPAMGHLAGYIGEISERELEQDRYKDAGYVVPGAGEDEPEQGRRGYRQGRVIGKSGIEQEYEVIPAGTGFRPVLGGIDGARFVEVDAMGRVVNPRPNIGGVAPRPGETLQLTIDAALQSYVHEIFPDTMKGAVVAMVPSTGEVLALYSNPTYDPNDFAGGLSSGLWRALNTDPDKPLLNRAINALYPPASTFKTATAAMALAEGKVQRDTRMPIPCTGGMSYMGRYARCWLRRGHGSLTLAEAIENSCNVYFYQLGARLGLGAMMERGTRMGFNRATGIDLPNEKPGIYPTGADFYRERFGNPPTPTEVLSLSIGQGPNSQSVLRMAYFYSAIAGNGTAPQPRLVVNVDGAVVDSVAPIDLGLDAAGLEDLWEGLRLVTEPGGTGLQSSLARYKLYGKTGTAQNPQGEDHAWFVGFAGAPGGPPEIAVAVLIEHGLHGSDAAPVAAKTANFYLDRLHGHPFDPEPTLGERWRAGINTWGQWDEPDRRLVPPASARRSAAGSTPPADSAAAGR